MAEKTVIISDGQLVFYLSADEGWVQGHIQGHDPKKGYSVKDSENGKSVTGVMADHVYPINNIGVLTEEVNDLLLLSELHESTVLHAVRRRYFEDIVYTNIGSLIVALNPFNYNIPWYKDDFMPHYLSEGPIIQKNKPHSWSVAHNTYYELQADRQNQCILVSGESGAGKTEAVKIVLKYIAGLTNMLAPDDRERAEQTLVNRRILLSSPILESFGNAKTGRNDNSSRFGKFLQVQFDGAGLVRGSVAINYLLERSRVLTAAQGERVYHAFYQLLRSPDAAKFGIETPRNYPSVMSGNTLEIQGMDDATGDDLSYLQTNLAFDVCGISPDDADGIWRTLAGILHCYRVKFKAISDDECEMVDEQYLATAADIWGASADSLKRSILTTTLEVRGETTVKRHNLAQAMTSRDSLLKSLYKYLFDWIFEKINLTTDGGDLAAYWIGLLDIFGFEDFSVNSFEQLCINLANETLQNHYNDYIFCRDMDECRAEGIDVTSIVFVDNKCTVDLLNQTKPPGIFALLDEECALGKGSDLGFLTKISDGFSKKHPSFEKKQLAKSSFIIKHFAGRVSYEVEGFLEKNKDSLKDELTLVMRDSTHPLIRELLPEPVDKRGRAATCSGIFRNQMQVLMALINSTNPHWIRCIKPHPAKKPRLFSQNAVIEQMRSSGVLETIRIRKAGYPIRIPLAEFVGRFKIMVPRKISTVDSAAASGEILAHVKFGKEMGQVGKTKVFLRAHTYQYLEELKKDVMHEYATTIQRWSKRRLGIFAVAARQYEKFKDIIEARRVAALERAAILGTALELRASLEAQWAAKWQEMLAEEDKAVGHLRRDIVAKQEQARIISAVADGAERLRAEESRAFDLMKETFRMEHADVVEAAKRRQDAAEQDLFIDAENDVRHDILDDEHDAWLDIAEWHVSALAALRRGMAEREEAARIAREAARVLAFKRRKAQEAYDRETRERHEVEARISERAAVHRELQAAVDTLHGTEALQQRRLVNSFVDDSRFRVAFPCGYSSREELEAARRGAAHGVPRVHGGRPRAAVEVVLPQRSSRHPVAVAALSSLSPPPKGMDVGSPVRSPGYGSGPAAGLSPRGPRTSRMPPKGAFSQLHYTGVYCGDDGTTPPTSGPLIGHGVKSARRLAPGVDSTVGLLTSLSALSVRATKQALRSGEDAGRADPYSPHWVPPPEDDSDVDEELLREMDIADAEAAGNVALASLHRRQQRDLKKKRGE